MENSINPYANKGKTSKLFLYWVSQNCYERVETKFLEEKNSQGHPHPKVGKKSNQVWLEVYLYLFVPSEQLIMFLPPPRQAPMILHTSKFSNSFCWKRWKLKKCKEWIERKGKMYRIVSKSSALNPNYIGVKNPFIVFF